MQKFCFIFLIFVLQAYTGIAQCPDGDLILNSKFDLTNYFNEYADCERIKGDIRIPINSTLDSLKGLNSIRVIEGSLLCKSFNKVRIIEGFTNLDSVGGSIEIIDEDELTSVYGFNNLETVDKIQVQSCKKLLKFEGFDKLNSINQLSIGSNDTLEIIPSFNKISKIFTLSISNNRNLDDIPSFENLKEITLLRVAGSPVDTLKILDSVRVISNLSIWGNDNLKQIELFSNQLDSIKSSIILSGNEVLDNIDFLENVSYIKLSNAYIDRNPNLANCTGLCNYLRTVEVIPDFFEVEFNKEGCNNVNEILESCLTNSHYLPNKPKTAIYPNPITPSSKVYSNREIKEVKVLDLHSRVVYNIIGKRKEVQLSYLDEYPPGQYVVLVTYFDSQNFTTHKIIKNL